MHKTVAGNGAIFSSHLFDFVRGGTFLLRCRFYCNKQKRHFDSTRRLLPPPLLATKTPDPPTACFCRSRRWEESFHTAGSGLIVTSLVPPAPPPAVARRPGVPTAWPRTKPKDLVTVQSSCFFFFFGFWMDSLSLSLLKWTCVASC